MKTENFVTWILLGYIAWKISEGFGVMGPSCGGVTSVPSGSNLTNVLAAGLTQQAAGGTLGCYQCGGMAGCGCG